VSKENQGVAASPPGHQPSASAAPLRSASSQSGVPNAVWLIWATEGEYSDRTEWPIAVTFDKEYGKRVTVRLGQLWRELLEIYRRRPDDTGDIMGEALFDSTPEGREYQALTGGAKGYLGGIYSEERMFYCCEVPVLPASGIEAATAGETRSGSTEGESPTPEGGDAQ
jgi:hypothetical protein